MIITEAFYFQPSSTDKDTECFIWFSSKKLMQNMIGENHADLYKNYYPISELPKYLEEHPKHKVHKTAIADVDSKKLKLRIMLKRLKVNLIS